MTAVNAETKAVNEFPSKDYNQGLYFYTPVVLGWTKNSLRAGGTMPSKGCPIMDNPCNNWRYKMPPYHNLRVHGNPLSTYLTP